MHNRLVKIQVVNILMILMAPAIFMAQTDLSPGLGIVPLHSTRADVEKIARFVESHGYAIEYEVNRHRIYVYYNTAECVTYGWKVPKDTVIKFDYYLNPGELPYEQIGKSSTSIETTDDSQTRYLTDRRLGITYVSPKGNPNVVRINYTAPAGYSKLRCKGFPEYDPSRLYAPYQSFNIPNIATWDAEEVYPSILSAEKYPDLEVTIIIYCKSGDESCYQGVKDRIEKFAGLTKSAKSNKFKIAFGGHRAGVQVETFVLPPEYSRPIASPTFPR